MQVSLSPNNNQDWGKYVGICIKKTDAFDNFTLIKVHNKVLN